MIEHPYIEKWIRVRILSDTGPGGLSAPGAALVIGAWADLIPEDQNINPETGGKPAVRYFPMGTPDVNGLSGLRILATGRYVICAVTRGASYGPLVAAAARLDALFHRSSGQQDAVTIQSCVRQEVYRQVEDNPDVQFRHLGGIFAIQASS